MKTILKFRWPIFIVLLGLAIGLLFVAPDLAKQAEEAGSFQLADDADSQKAADILEQAGASEDTLSLVYDFDKAVSDEDKKAVQATAKEIADLGKPVTAVMDPFESAEIEDQLVSEDKKTVLVPITVDGSEEEVIDLSDKIRSEMLPKDTTVYLTGEAIINNDVNDSAQEGLKKTEVITVVLIFALLLIVFRSIVTPIVPLIAVGITYLLSQSLVAFFVDWFGFPVSNYTQIFLVAILFGLGTDYCILLLSRYKEELIEGHEIQEAIVNTYKTAGRTLIISSLAVFIGFAAIGFADFPIFKSAVAVAVGIAVLILVLFTVVPLFMMLLKDKLFWPAKQATTHNDSKLWVRFSKLSVSRPLLSMAIVAVITVPLLLTYDNDLSFNTVDEIDQSKESVKGLNLISEGFGKGDSLPVQVILKSDSSIVDEKDVPYLETISRNLEKVDGVKSVRTITRPTGEQIDELNVDTQLGLLSDGLKEANDGIKSVQDGLGQVEGGLNDAASQLPSGSEASSGGAGLRQAAQGIGQINDQLGQIAGGLSQGMPAAQAAGGLNDLSAELGKISTSLNGAAGQIEGSGSQIGQLSGGLSQLAKGVTDSKNGLTEISKGLTEVTDMLKDMSETPSIRDTGIYIPAGTLGEEEFQPVIDRYTFGDETGILMEVILKDDPYARESIATVHAIKDSVRTSVIGTPFEDTEVAFAGISSMNSDLDDISSQDFTRTVVIMLVGLFVVLTILFRSAIMPLYMIGSLLLTYYTAISVTELIFVNILGYDGISWAVPFFGFIMLIALGVDYSIFLLDRFREESIKGSTIADALKISMAKMGTVIITAAVILAGTFGAMMPSGVLSLVQIATIVITGLLLYGLIILPLLIPAITVSFGRGVWWPFRG
ncbi:MMPL family transporter [Sporosarcina sp. BI001-red]|uniref:MMPL family transporter n=1 Tax=Sporosarcina sp. BI001-red TaxID=2282866 RepID=UPI000E26DBA5|nr:MMPL family transporter [Sporosarcina sp. BI001-red]REB07852.1 MMPL family transporter [Sporosarcina sp. BI001-red]